MSDLADTPGVATRIAPVFSGVLVALLPKCPACVGAYLSALGGFGAVLPPTWVWPLSWALLAAGLALRVPGLVRSRAWPPLVALTAGVVALALARTLDGPTLSFVPGVALLLVGSLGGMFLQAARALRRTYA